MATLSLHSAYLSIRCIRCNSNNSNNNNNDIITKNDNSNRNNYNHNSNNNNNTHLVDYIFVVLFCLVYFLFVNHVLFFLCICISSP